MSDPSVREKCVFCQIVDGTGKASIVYEDEEIMVFRDIKPAAKNHLLAIPRQHIKDAKCLVSENKPLVESLKKSLENAFESLGDDHKDVIYGFHWPPFHSVNHLHLHGISPRSEMGFTARIIFKENSWWFVSPEYVLSRL